MRPTPEEIADARSRLRYWLHPSRAHLLADQCVPQIETLLAATEPVSPLPADGSGWCQMCEKHGLYAEHQCFFGPVKP